MTSLHDLPAEQRAVLELVLRRGRSYDEIASMLSIDRARVRQRALAGLDALGPTTSVPPERRALITDYLLGQLPARVNEQVAQRLAQDPGDRAWARVVASELRPVAAAPLPRIPAGGELAEPVSEPTAGEGGTDDTSAGHSAAAPAASESRAPAAPPVSTAPASEPAGSAPGRDSSPRSSRLGGAILLGIGALVVVVVVVVILLNWGSSKSPSSSSGSAAASTPTGAASTATGTTGTTPKSLATVKLSPPSSSSKAQGVAEAFVQSGKIYLALVAINLAANSHNFYAVWLSNSPSDSRLIGFSPPVTSNGRLQAAGTLRTSDNRYKQLLLTVETTAHPKSPGTTVLSGPFSLKSS